jgi:5'-methylthioadenosine phosphorylase
VKLAIIGGTGVYDPAILDRVREETVETPYGQVTLKVGEYRGVEVGFLARHGTGHTVPPHKINYRANIAALKLLGVERAIATSAVGSLNPDMKPGTFVLLDQFIDFTKARAGTFFDGGPNGVVHLDYSEPYCPEIRAVLAREAASLGIDVKDGGCYVCTEGPRFETPAEIRAFRIIGGDLVGMTSVPEVVLAREAGICYASIAMATNWAAGISPTPLTHEEVVEVMQANGERLRALAMRAIEAVPEERGCRCGKAGAVPPWARESGDGA